MDLDIARSDRRAPFHRRNLAGTLCVAQRPGPAHEGASYKEHVDGGRSNNQVHLQCDTEPVTDIESLRATEERFQRAQLCSDVDTLDLLLHRDLVFCGPDASIGDKSTDLDAHRTGQIRIHFLDPEDLIVRVTSGVGITILTARMAGESAENTFSARMRYTRTWAFNAQGWQVVAAHISMLEPDVST